MSNRTVFAQTCLDLRLNHLYSWMSY